MRATAIAHPNIAFIKYWGSDPLNNRLPANGSISMNLGKLYSRVRVEFSPKFDRDQLLLDGNDADRGALSRVSQHLDRIRLLAGVNYYASVEGFNNFPMGTGIASSASAFAALSLAATRALGLKLNQDALSSLAREGSGSACRSIPEGFVEWRVEKTSSSSAAFSLAPPTHWELVDCVTVISYEHKATTSEEGHVLASTSPLQEARVADAPRRLDICRRAILERDFEALAEIAELDALMMHSVMMTSSPPLLYWEPTTLKIMKAVRQWRDSGIPVFYTIDAGPNVHVITLGKFAAQVEMRLNKMEGVLQVISSPPGGPARIVE